MVIAPTLSAAGCELPAGFRFQPLTGPPRLKGKRRRRPHPLPQGGDGRKLHKAKKAQHKCKTAERGEKFSIRLHRQSAF